MVAPSSPTSSSPHYRRSTSSIAEAPLEPSSYTYVSSSSLFPHDPMPTQRGITPLFASRLHGGLDVPLATPRGGGGAAGGGGGGVYGSGGCGSRSNHSPLATPRGSNPGSKEHSGRSLDEQNASKKPRDAPAAELYLAPTFEALSMYDSDDLDESAILILLSPHALYVWVGDDADADSAAALAAEFKATMGATSGVHLAGSLAGLPVLVERQGEESVAFWAKEFWPHG